VEFGDSPIIPLMTEVGACPQTPARLYRDAWGHRACDFPAAAAMSDRTLSLLRLAKITDDDVDDVIAASCSVRRRGGGGRAGPR